MPENETAVREHPIAGAATLVGYNPSALTAVMAVALALLVGFADSADPQPAALAFSTSGRSIPIFEVLTVAVWIAALVVIRRLTSPSEIAR